MRSRVVLRHTGMVNNMSAVYDGCLRLSVIFSSIWLAIGVNVVSLAWLYGGSLVFALSVPEVKSFGLSLVLLVQQATVLYVPWTCGIPIFRAVSGYCGVYVMVRAVQLLHHRAQYAASARESLAASPGVLAMCTLDWFVLHPAHEREQVEFAVDTRLKTGGSRSHAVDGVALRQLLQSGASAAAVQLCGLSQLSYQTWPWTTCFLHGLSSMASLCALDAAFRAYWSAHGVILAPIMRAPWEAHSLRAFWGSRWNSMVRRMLAEVVYVPLRCAGASRALGAFATFLVSGALHAYPVVLASCGDAPRAAAHALYRAGSVTSFFVVQCALVLLEQRLFALYPATPEVVRRTCLLAALWLPSPLLFVPYMEVGAGTDDGGECAHPPPLAGAMMAMLWAALAVSSFVASKNQHRKRKR